MNCDMHDRTGSITVKVHHYPKVEDDPDGFDLWLLRIKDDEGRFTIYFRDLDNLVDLTRSLSMRVTDLRHDQGRETEGV